ncbi:MAG: hypothetical protein HRT66_08825 [Flavobacteriaceae bacterium]|nr:hypothetical protein [Flavobacteriaceae bacterium]
MKKAFIYIYMAISFIAMLVVINNMFLNIFNIPKVIYNIALSIGFLSFPWSYYLKKKQNKN